VNLISKNKINDNEILVGEENDLIGEFSILIFLWKNYHENMS